MAPIAVALCGKQPPILTYMIKNAAETLDIVHTCTSTETAVAELPALLRGEAIAPSSGFGTNTGSSAPRSDLAFIIIGGGYSPEEVASIKAATDAVKPLPFFVADKAKTAPGTVGPPAPDVIKQRLLDAITSEAKGENEWDPKVFPF